MTLPTGARLGPYETVGGIGRVFRDRIPLRSSRTRMEEPPRMADLPRLLQMDLPRGQSAFLWGPRRERLAMTVGCLDIIFAAPSY